MMASTDKIPEFNYFLNAYISSARSVLWIMQNEFKHIDGWREWYDSFSETEDMKALLKGIVDMRNRSLKQQPLQISEFITIGNETDYFDLIEELQPFDKQKVDLTIQEVKLKSDKPKIFRGENELKITGKLNIRKTVKEFKNKDIVDICIQYNTWLLEIVDECLAKFS